MSLLRTVEVPRLPVSRLGPVIGAPRYPRSWSGVPTRVGRSWPGRTIWNVNSTAAGGGVAEMLQVVVGYVQDLDISIGWLVIAGDAMFFAITKRLHNQIHRRHVRWPARRGGGRSLRADARRERGGAGSPGSGPAMWCCCTTRRPLAWPRRWRRRVPGWCGAATSAWTGKLTRPGQGGISCGRTWPQRRHARSRAGNTSLSWIPAGKAWIIPPSIDPFSPKNQQLGADTVQAILVKLGVLDGAAPTVPATFVRRDGEVGVVTSPAVIVGEGRPGPDDPVLVQVSRWDRLKDMAGVMRGFANHVAPFGGMYLMLVGPSVTDVSDDPEGAAVYGECLLQWRDLSPATRTRILLVTLPLDDIDENAVMVNALQQHATVIAQKSLAEGFGLSIRRYRKRSIWACAVVAALV